MGGVGASFAVRNVQIIPPFDFNACREAVTLLKCGVQRLYFPSAVSALSPYLW